MSAADDAWAVVQPALVELQENPDQAWETQLALLRDRLLVAEPWTTDALLLWLDGVPEQERAELLTANRLPELAYQVLLDQAPADEYVGAAGDGVAEESAGGYDEGVWQAYLVENGSSWDGTAESWAGFREWFLYYAAERGVAEPATGLLTYLDVLSVDERVAVFAQYGVTIAAPGTPPSAAETADGAAAQEARVATPAAGTEDAPAVVTAEQEVLAAQIAAEVPGIDQLTEEELASILAEVASEGGR